MPSDVPQTIKADLPPPGYNVIHKHRGLSTEGKGLCFGNSMAEEHLKGLASLIIEEERVKVMDTDKLIYI